MIFPDEQVTEDLPTSSSFIAVPWMWVGVHTGRVDDLPEDAVGRGFPVRDPTGRVVTVEGLTLLQRTEDDQMAFHRFVDWLGAYSQLGVLMAGRTPFQPRSTA